jgi:hypothetical protein
MRAATVEVLQEFAAKKREREQAHAFAVDLASERASRRRAEGAALEVTSARALCALPDPPASEELLGPLLVRGSVSYSAGTPGRARRRWRSRSPAPSHSKASFSAGGAQAVGF